MTERERESLWQRKRAGFHRDAARSEIAENTQPLTMVFVFAVLVFVAFGFDHVREPRGWASFAAAVLCLATLLGLRSGRHWARFVCGGLAGVAALGGAWSVLASLATLDLHAFDRVFWQGMLTIAWGWSAWSLLGPGARERFERARHGPRDATGEPATSERPAADA